MNGSVCSSASSSSSSSASSSGASSCRSRASSLCAMAGSFRGESIPEASATITPLGGAVLFVRSLSPLYGLQTNTREAPLNGDHGAQSREGALVFSDFFEIPRFIKINDPNEMAEKPDPLGIIHRTTTLAHLSSFLLGGMQK